MSYCLNVSLCHECLRDAGVSCSGGCPCPVDGKEVMDHARWGDCPKSLHVSPPPNTAVLSGCYGDIIYALPAVRALKQRHVKLVDIPAPSQSERLTKQRAASILPLLRAQPYIQSAEWTSENLWHPLVEDWKRHCKPHETLADLYLQHVGKDPLERNKAWLEVSQPFYIGWPVIINRTARYQNPLFPWRRVLEKYKYACAFVGLPEEHKVFCEEFGHVPFHSTSDHLQLAKVLAGAKLFCGNQSSCLAVAEGLKKRVVVEVCERVPDCIYDREGAVHGWNQYVDLPEIG